MSKKLSYVALESIDTLRLTCRALLCSGAVEVSLAKLASSDRAVTCPDCGAVLRAAVKPGQADAFTKLAQAVEDLKRLALLEHLGVTVVLPRE